MTFDDSQSPSTHGTNGRTAAGQFAPGNRLGRGNPLAGRAAKLRAALLKEVKRADVRKVVRKLIDAACNGDVTAARELLNRVIGTATPSDVLERIEALEQAQNARHP